MSKHILLGAGGTIGQVLVPELLSHSERVRLVTRAGFSLPGTEASSADLTDARQVREVIENESTVYLIAGLKYRTEVWREQWPKIMRNVIDACSAKHSRLIFFDNVYMYGRVDGPMTEQTPVNPVSKKGEIRAQIAATLLEESRKGNITALIARSADFYGPFADKSSLPYLFVFSKLLGGRKAQVLVNAKAKHSFTYSGDCGKALYLLATGPDAWNQVWHLPTARPALTTEEFIALAARTLNANPSYSVMPPWMVKLAGLFVADVREVYEMLYQNAYDYEFDSTKFERHFSFTPTPYERGIAETIAYYRRQTL